MAWSDYRNENWDIYFSKSTNFGQSFLFPNVRIDDPTTGITDQGSASLRAFECGKICVLWDSYWPSNNYDIWADLSVNGGDSWGTDFRISDYTSNNQDVSTLVLDREGRLYCGWSDDRTRLNYPDIYSTWFSLAPCDTPKLIAPPDNSKGPEDRLFVWHPVAHASSYRLKLEELNEDDSVKQIVKDTTVIDSSCFISGLTPGSRLHWQVAGKTTWATGPWSSKRT